MKDHWVTLTIGGSDPSGGAGIQADLKTFFSLGLYGASVITAVTAQNFTNFSSIQPVKPEIVCNQMVAILEELPIKAIKTGMLYSAEIIEAVSNILIQYRQIPIIIDPVFAATSGKKLIEENAIESLKKKLFPLAYLITPNISEAEILIGEPLKTRDDIAKCIRELYDQFKKPVLVKGGHLEVAAIDTLFDGEGLRHYTTPLVQDVNSHGSGCTLASAITAFIAKGKPLRESVSAAKTFVTQALKNPLKLTSTLHVINHFGFKKP
jgi:hydroxymethylpyrimidine kinase/phosphomethylpyrimidine kinase